MSKTLSGTLPEEGLTQLGGPDELACDFERRGLRDDAGDGI
jgi:hypothetical protein